MEDTAPFRLIRKTEPVGVSVSLTAVCVRSCPENQEDTLDCISAGGITCPSTADPEAGGHVGYGTINLFNKFCLPDITDLNPDVEAQYSEIIGDFGIDDIQDYIE